MKSQAPLSAQQLAYGLGVFSIVLGLAEVAAPRTVRRSAGSTAPTGLIMAFGLREIASGALLLLSRRPVRWLWARVAGDVLDVAAMAPDAANRDNPYRGRAIAATATLLAVTAVDFAIACSNGNNRHG